MAILRGAGGGLVFDGGAADAVVTQWTMDHNVELADTTAMGDKDRTFDTYTLRNTTGSGSAYYDPGNAGIAKLDDYIVSSTTPASAVLRLETVDGSAGYTGTAWISGITLGASVDGVITFNFNYQYTGGVTAI